MLLLNVVGCWYGILKSLIPFTKSENAKFCLKIWKLSSNLTMRWAILCFPCSTGTALPAPSASHKRLFFWLFEKLEIYCFLKKAWFHIKILINISKITKIIWQHASISCKFWELLNMVFQRWDLFWESGLILSRFV